MSEPDVSGEIETRPKKRDHDSDWTSRRENTICVGRSVRSRQIAFLVGIGVDCCIRD